MTAAELSALSDQELSEKVAIEVAGMECMPAGPWVRAMGQDVSWYDRTKGPFCVSPPTYATSASRVLTLIGMNYFSANRNPFNGVWTATVGAAPVFEAQDKSFARAVCVSLLLAKGAA